MKKKLLVRLIKIIGKKNSNSIKKGVVMGFFLICMYESRRICRNVIGCICIVGFC